MNEYDVLFLFIVSIFSIIGFSLNLILLLLIIFKSPESLTPYRVFLFDTSFTQLIFAILTFVNQPRVLSDDAYTIVIHLGPIQILGKWLTAMTFLGMVHLALNSFISIMLSMVYRYLSINDYILTTRDCIIMCLMGYTIPFLSYLSVSTINLSTDPILAYKLVGNVVENLGQYEMVIVTTVVGQPSLLIFILLISVGYVPIYAIMFWCRKKIYEKLREHSESHSSTTKKNVKRLVRALTIQSLIPIFSIFPASIFFCLALTGLIDPTVHSYIIVPCICISCMADPAITIHSVLPFRRYIRRFFRQDTDKVMSVTVEVTRSSFQ